MATVTKPLLLLDLTGGYMHVCYVILYIEKYILNEKRTQSKHREKAKQLHAVWHPYDLI